ncbi:MAG TPA: hypothetical protein VH025_01915 [Solirubrobacteraceae bacterium]|jgi:hypothetical protein|nr:hypothetical protein [Solirubrobacteraceae bacterium]
MQRRPGFPRPLNDRECEVLDHLLGHEFRGIEALRAQRRSVQVRGYHNDQPTYVLLEVADRQAPRIELGHPIPAEASVSGADPPQEVTLFVKDGLLDAIELIDYGGDAAVEFPPTSDLAAPTSNVGE